LLFVLLPTAPCFAQSSPSANNATCKIDQTPSTQIELTFYRDDYKKTAELAAADLKADPKNRRSRQLEIDSLIGMDQLDEDRRRQTHGPPQNQPILLRSLPLENFVTPRVTGWSHIC
jgi:hypothetical protein